MLHLRIRWNTLLKLLTCLIISWLGSEMASVWIPNPQVDIVSKAKPGKDNFLK